MNTQERLAAALKKPLQAGYVTYTGHVMTDAECITYNRYTAEAARPGISGQAREFLLDQRHRFFVLISESRQPT
ncbi:hypothetical protein [Mixta sp. Marseille-Q2659]|uniref:hypothetical protein n=1 Tax=Mixta sp. Marseille-Q2659 TaxID=2736607 RepID=UPI0023B91CDB|nr:hypothetical protein [Mixta sp. Marseille-Q2659]